jgi:DNA-binding LacI/PurR family transcriptional regulator
LSSIDKRVTLAQVARVAGVSKTTVSVVLNGGAEALGIRAATQAQVLDAASSLGYSPNYAARMLRRGRTGILTLLVNQLANPVFVDMALTARAAAESGGYDLEVVDAGAIEAEVRALEHLRGGRADGVMVATGRHHGRRPAVDRLLDLVGQGMPAVVLIDQSPDPRVPAIRADVFGGSLEAVRHLVALGHRRIGHVTLHGAGDIAAARSELTDEPSSLGDRYRGYRQALAEADIPLDDSLLARGPDTLAGGGEAMRQLLALDSPPTAVFVFNDLPAIGAIRACFEVGVRVPDDLAIVALGGVELGAYVTPALTSVRIPAVDMANQAVQMLFDVMTGGVSNVDRVLPARLLVRESCGATRRGGVQS